METIAKKYPFGELQTGQVFRHNGTRWIVCTGIKYNAVQFENQDVKALFHSACVIEIETNITPDEWDLIDDEEVLRSIEGYKENF